MAEPHSSKVSASGVSWSLGTYVGSAALLLLVLAFHARALGIPFQGDEYIALRHFGAEDGIAKAVQGFGTTQYDLLLVQFYRPLPGLLWAFDVRAWGSNPVGFHLGSVFFYAANAAAVLALARVLLGSFAGAFAAAAFFAIHPLHAEVSVLSISRYTTLAFFFAVAALLAYAGYRRRGRRIGPYAAAAWSIVALACSELGLLAALAIGLEALLGEREDERAPRRAGAILGAVPTFAVVVAYLAARKAAFGEMLGGYTGDLPIAATLETLVRGFPALGAAFVRLVAPVPLALSGPEASWFGGEARGAAAFAVSFTAFALAARGGIGTRELRRAAYFVALFVVASLPYHPVWETSLDEAGQRTWYASSLATCLLLGGAVGLAWDRGARVAAAAGGLGVAALYGTLLVQAVSVYVEAGRDIRALHTGTRAYLREHPQADPVLVEGAAWERNGAFVWTWGLPESFGPPIVDRPRRVFPARPFYAGGTDPVAMGATWGLANRLRFDAASRRVSVVRDVLDSEIRGGSGSVLFEADVNSLATAAAPDGGGPGWVVPAPEGEASFVLEVTAAVAGANVRIEARSAESAPRLLAASAVGDARPRRYAFPMAGGGGVLLRFRNTNGDAVAPESASVAVRRGIPDLAVQLPTTGGAIEPADLRRPLVLRSGRSPAYRATLFTHVGAHVGIVASQEPTVYDVLAAPIGPSLHLGFPLFHCLDLGESTAFLRLEGLSEPDNPHSLVSASALVPFVLAPDLLRRDAEIDRLFPSPR